MKHQSSWTMSDAMALKHPLMSALIVAGVFITVTIQRMPRADAVIVPRAVMSMMALALVRFVLFVRYHPM